MRRSRQVSLFLAILVLISSPSCSLYRWSQAAKESCREGDEDGCARSTMNVPATLLYYLYDKCIKEPAEEQEARLKPLKDACAEAGEDSEECKALVECRAGLAVDGKCNLSGFSSPIQAMVGGSDHPNATGETVAANQCQADPDEDEEGRCRHPAHMIKNEGFAFKIMRLGDGTVECYKRDWVLCKRCGSHFGRGPFQSATFEDFDHEGSSSTSPMLRAIVQRQYNSQCAGTTTHPPPPEN